MDYSVAFKSVKGFIVGEVLGMISSVLFGFSSFMVQAITYAFQFENANIVSYLAIGVTCFLVISIALYFVAIVIQVISLFKLRKYDNQIKGAVIILILVFVDVCMSLIFPNFVVVSVIMNVVEELADMWIAVAVIQAFINITDSLDDYELSKRGLKVNRIVITLLSITILGDVVFRYLLFNPSFILGTIITLIVISVIKIFTYVHYISYLKKLEKLFKEKSMLVVT